MPGAAYRTQTVCMQPTEQGYVLPDTTLMARVAALVAERGERSAALALCVAKPTLVRLIAGLRVTRAVVSHVEMRLASLAPAAGTPPVAARRRRTLRE